MTLTCNSSVEERFEEWLQNLRTSLIETLGEDSANASPDSWKSHLTTIEVGFASYNFWVDSDYIFCNGLPIMSCFNDHWTAEAIFFETLKLTFPEAKWDR